MSGQFKDERCAACGHERRHHERLVSWFPPGRCLACPHGVCQRFIPRPAGDEKREGEG